MKDVLTNVVPLLKLKNPGACFHTGDQLNTNFEGRPWSDQTVGLLKYNCAGQLIDWDKHMGMFKTVVLLDGRRGYHDHGYENAEAQCYDLSRDNKGKRGWIYAFKPKSGFDYDL